MHTALYRLLSRVEFEQSRCQPGLTWFKQKILIQVLVSEKSWFKPGSSKKSWYKPWSLSCAGELLCESFGWSPGAWSVWTPRKAANGKLCKPKMSTPHMRALVLCFFHWCFRLLWSQSALRSRFGVKPSFGDLVQSPTDHPLPRWSMCALPLQLPQN